MPDPAQDPDGDQAGLVTAWMRVVAATAYVPRSSTEVRTLLTALLGRLTDTLAVAEPDTSVGLRTGELMVEGALTGESTLEGSLGVLADGLTDAGYGARPVARLLASVSAGYAAALRKRTLAQQENMKLALLTAKQRAERDRRATESRFREVFDAAAVGIAITELDGTFVETNPALATILGRPTEDLRQRTLVEFIADDDEPPLVVGEADRRRVIRPGGDTAWVYLTTSMLRDDNGVARYRVTMVQDLSEIQLLGNQLSHQSLHDALTGLPNRMHFESRLEAMHAQMPPERLLTLLCLDLDAFALVNTTYGHSTGDRVLRTVANRLTAAVSAKKALVARIGGDEFAVLIAHESPPPPVSTLVSALEAELSEPDYDGGGVGLAVSATTGAVRCTKAEMSATEMFRAADAALRHARSLGKHQWTEFDAHADRAARKLGTLATGLPAAWENGELRIAYQPVVRLADLTPVRVRALAHLTADRDAAELAELTGLSVPLGPWLLTRSAEHLDRWLARFEPVVDEDEAVHRVLLSPTQSADADLSATVNAVLGATCAAPGSLEIGLDTAAVLGCRGDAQDNLRTLSDIGVITAVHGFTGGPREVAMVERFGVRTVILSDPFEGWRPDWLPREAVPVRATVELIAALRSAGASVGVLGVRDHAEATWWAAQGVRTAEGPAFGRPAGWTTSPPRAGEPPTTAHRQLSDRPPHAAARYCRMRDVDESDPARRQRLTNAAAGALAAMRAGEDDGALDRVAAAVRSTPNSHVDARELMLLLFHECSAMVSALGSGGTTPVKMQVYDDDGHEVPIDEADPPVRTAVRTLLAQVHGDTDGAKAQIEIALTNAAPEEMATLMVQALRWTLRLSEECVSRGLAVPSWVREE